MLEHITKWNWISDVHRQCVFVCVIILCHLGVSDMRAQVIRRDIYSTHGDERQEEDCLAMRLESSRWVSCARKDLSSWPWAYNEPLNSVVLVIFPGLVNLQMLRQAQL